MASKEEPSNPALSPKGGGEINNTKGVRKRGVSTKRDRIACGLEIDKNPA